LGFAANTEPASATMLPFFRLHQDAVIFIIKLANRIEEMEYDCVEDDAFQGRVRALCI
jgi:hypothetical protein